MSYLVNHPILILFSWVLIITGVVGFLLWAAFGYDWWNRWMARREWERSRKQLLADLEEVEGCMSQLPDECPWSPTEGPEARR